MSLLSNFAESLIGSEIVKLGNAINERRNQGETIYNYTIGDFDPSIFPIPSLLKEYIIAAYQNNHTNYPAGDGILQLRQAVGDLFRRVENIDYANDEIQISSGGRPIIYTLFKTVVNKGDKVIYTVPSWNNNHYVHMNDGIHCKIEVLPENNFMPTAADIAPHIKDAALLCLCSPQNPTGTTLAKNELIAICDLVIAENEQRGPDEKKLYVLFDQMYWTLTYGDIQHHNPVALRPKMKDYTIFVDGISKSFASTGVRVGWAMGPKKVIAKMKALLSHIGAWAPMAEQVATAKYLQETTDMNNYLADIKSKLAQRLEYIYQRFQTIKSKGYDVDAIQPQAALYLTVKFNLKGYKWNDLPFTAQQQVSDFLLADAKLAIVPFNCFGGDHESPWYRISVGTCKMEELEMVFNQLENSLAKLTK